MNLHHPEARVRMAVPESGTRPHDYGTGRVCAAEGCTTVLSRYNEGPFCGCCETKGVTVTNDAVLAYVRTHDWVSSGEVSKALSIGPSAAKYHLQKLAKAGLLESDGKGGRGYRLLTVKSAPGGPPASAPDPRREPPAEEAAAPVPGTPTGAPPSAGEDVDAVGNESVWLEIQVAPDREVAAIESCVAVLEDLEQAARDRVITYLGQRYWK